MTARQDTWLDGPVSAGLGTAASGQTCLLQRHHALTLLRTHPQWSARHLLTLWRDDDLDVTDEPPDVHPRVRRVGIQVNDALLAPSPFQRLDLEPRIRALEPLLTDTADADPLTTASWRAATRTWALRVWLPAWLDLVPTLTGHAAWLRTCAAADVEDAVLTTHRAVPHGTTAWHVWLFLLASAQSVAVLDAGDLLVDTLGDFGRQVAHAALRHAMAQGAVTLPDLIEYVRPAVTVCQDSALALLEGLLGAASEVTHAHA